MNVGVAVKNSTKGSGHVILRYRERNGAIASKYRKRTEKWQPHSVMSTLKHLQVSSREFLAVLTRKSTPDQQEDYPSRDDWPVDDPG